MALLILLKNAASTDPEILKQLALETFKIFTDIPILKIKEEPGLAEVFANICELFTDILKGKYAIDPLCALAPCLSLALV
mmetsp:Transcript_22381/g.10772  ORF Transcript_22381/g.10772 Transcript_22381/m.10772 type:complete len:80 (+) Transcript_22381:360-599(+)|eukprot:CAMPEP_0201281492 /NCGR_PEP_ID=MMETSP1317-20130820/2979_1 /ASSEMBLY_ACC=CAM_ASM_000770 /TAXON_ID=187299 /ORGANISM="Undescribed Undescribed, Strain Undescribed" /LENGTH=79 /DNA_ID=CAMNT_0047591421 /DNA_START=360 /DNA_END=599 /DNA_ORIENTATION=+